MAAISTILGVLASRVERITQKHVALNILPEHYHFVAEALLGAIKDVLGDAATDEVLEAWGEAYWFLADLLMARESNIYARLTAAQGGWNGWRDFTVEATKQESEVIRSFILVPTDGDAVMHHRPGQYLTFALDVPGAGRLKRNYSISSAPDGSLLSHQRQARGEAGVCLPVSPRTGCTIMPPPARCSRWRRLPESSSSMRRTTVRSCCSVAALDSRR